MRLRRQRRAGSGRRRPRGAGGGAAGGRDRDAGGAHDRAGSGVRRYLLDRARLRRLDLARRRHPRRRLAVGAGQSQLDVGGVAAFAAEDDLVLTGLGVGHVLVADAAAHHAGVALDHHAVHATALVDAVVGADVLAVALLQRLVAHVEAVRVFHDELTGAQDAALGPRLVACLGLEVIPELRQLLV